MIELVGLNQTELRELAVSCGQPAYRGDQLAKWLYQKQALTLDSLTDLPKAFRAELGQREASLKLLEQALVQVDRDGTSKYLFELQQGGSVESVLLPFSDRLSACISTQVGCPIGCAFCATGQSGFARNLSAGEIVDQIRLMQREGGRISHVVLMGMGEPLLNYEATVKAIAILNKEMGIGMRQISLSTCGVVPRMYDLAKEKLALTLAVSLHAPEDALRDRLVPINKTYPLAELKEAMRHYATETGRRITIEYVMLKGVNDSPAMAQSLSRYLHGVHCQINLIPYHPTDGEFQGTVPREMREFADKLNQDGFPTTIRADRGLDIQAACGQLRREAER